MRARELCMLALFGACVANPDPRHTTLQDMERNAFGGWVVVTTTQHASIQGELVALDPGVLYVLPSGQTRAYAIPRDAIAHAELYEYTAEGLGAWAVAGAVSTISHGFFLVFSFPIWVLTGIGANHADSSHVVLHYPDDPWDELAKWARFPQGLPPSMRPRPPAPAPTPEPPAPEAPAPAPTPTPPSAG